MPKQPLLRDLVDNRLIIIRTQLVRSAAAAAADDDNDDDGGGGGGVVTG